MTEQTQARGNGNLDDQKLISYYLHHDEKEVRRLRHILGLDSPKEQWDAFAPINKNDGPLRLIHFTRKKPGYRISGKSSLGATESCFNQWRY